MKAVASLRRNGRLAAAGIIAAVAVAACNDNDPTALARVDSVILSPQDTTILMPEEPTEDDGGFRYQVQLLDDQDDPITGERIIEWESSDPLTAQVSGSGYVTPKKAGPAIIYARSGGTTGAATLLVQDP